MCSVWVHGPGACVSFAVAKFLVLATEELDCSRRGLQRLPTELDARFASSCVGQANKQRAVALRQHNNASHAVSLQRTHSTSYSSIAADQTSARELVRVEIRVFWLVFCNYGLKCCEATITRATFAGLQHGRPKAYRADAARYRSRPSACRGPREVTSSRAGRARPVCLDGLSYAVPVHRAERKSTRGAS